jgi:hypothetical protein
MRLQVQVRVTALVADMLLLMRETKAGEGQV